MEWLLKKLGLDGDIALGGAGLGLLYKGYEDLKDLGQTGLTLGQELAQTQLEQAAFRPYTVTTATGGRFGMMQDPETGAMTYQLGMSPEEQAFQQGMFGGAGQFFQQAQVPTGDREAACPSCGFWYSSIFRE